LELEPAAIDLRSLPTDFASTLRHAMLRGYRKLG
jgi:hypothetical protein